MYVNLLLCVHLVNPLPYGIIYFLCLFQFFPGNLKKNSINSNKMKKVMGYFRGENIYAREDFFFYNALSPPHPRKI